VVVLISGFQLFLADYKLLKNEYFKAEKRTCSTGFKFFPHSVMGTFPPKTDISDKKIEKNTWDIRGSTCLYSLPLSVRTPESRWMKYVGHTACMKYMTNTCVLNAKLKGKKLQWNL
jgi:hypothetical protein